jgi:hypothetical protein
MRLRIGSFLLAAAFIAAAPGYAQHVGLRIAIAPPPAAAPVAPPVPPVIAPMASPIQPFVTAPVSSFAVAPAPFRGFAHFGPPLPVVAIPVAPPAPITVVYVPVPVYVAAPAPRIHHPRVEQPSAPAQPALGTPRANVIAQFGMPVVSILTANSETLHYSGGMVVVLRNGAVVTQ